MKKIHIIVSGTVTGVGFRWWLKKKANERSIYGWVKNKTTGEVEAVLIGKEKDVDELINLTRKGPSFAQVKNLNIQNYYKDYFNKSFEIKK